MGVLEGRVAVVTGASSGVGRVCALRFAEEGASVVICARRMDRLEAVVQDVEARGGRAVAVTCDVARPSDIDAVVAAAADRFGRIDILANVAQGGLEMVGSTPLSDPGSVAHVISSFETGPLQCMLFMQKCFPHMREQGYGRIINTAGHVAYGSPNSAAYSLAKGALMSLTRCAAKEWGEHGIVTNTILPTVLTESWDYTERSKSYKESIPEMIPLKRLGTAYEDLGPVVVFLASEGAGYLNGQAIAIDGGWKLIA